MIRVRAFDGYVETEAQVYANALALHPIAGERIVKAVQGQYGEGRTIHYQHWKYSVTHVPSGMTFHNCDTLAEGKRIILASLAAQEAGGWDWATLAENRAAVEALWQIKTARPAPAPSGKTPTLAPVLARGVEGSKELDSLTRRLNRAWLGGPDEAADFLPAAEALTAVAQWEEIVARMAAGQRAIIEPEDVPRRTPGPAGVEPGLPTVKRLFRELMALGTEIDELAGQMLGLATVGDPTGEDEDRWRQMDRDLRAKIQTGWEKWSVLAYLFSGLSTSDQAPFLSRLGFIGSKVDGWTALGRKTFLRSATLSALLPHRRRIRAELTRYGDD